MKALSIKPPLQPSLRIEQSISYCSERSRVLFAFFASIRADSKEPVAEKAQQDPH